MFFTRTDTMPDRQTARTFTSRVEWEFTVLILHVTLYCTTDMYIENAVKLQTTSPAKISDNCFKFT